MPENSEPLEPTPQAKSHPKRLEGKSLFKILLEVVLISLGVFLGLMGDQYLERAEHREAAEASLRRFRTEIIANRQALDAVREYHATTARGLQEFFQSDKPKTPDNFRVMFHGIGPVHFEHTAWDLAITTQSLTYLDQDLAYALSRTYTLQQGYLNQQTAIVQSTIYGRSWTQDFEGYWRSLMGYFADLTILDPGLMKAYDDVLPRLNRALGSAPAP
jgi:hypothetical protein